MRKGFLWLKFLLFVLLGAVGCSPAVNHIPGATPTAVDADPEFTAAVQQAHDTLDVFIQDLESPRPLQTFMALKVRLAASDGSSQDTWTQPVSYQDGAFKVILGDDFVLDRGLRSGDSISVPVEDVVDWMIVEAGKLVGGYTIRLAYRRMSPQERELFLKDAGYVVE